MEGILLTINAVLLIVIIALFLQNRSVLKKEALKSEAIEQMRYEHMRYVNQLKDSHSQIVRNLESQMHNLAGEKFQEWKDKESENIRLREREIALREASSQLEYWKYSAEISIRNDAIQKSHSTILGQVSEHIAPYMPDFTFNPKDVRFVGSPIDLVIFDGLDEDDIHQIIFVEVKTGAAASLSRRQRQIRDVILAKKIGWMELRINRELGEKT